MNVSEQDLFLAASKRVKESIEEFRAGGKYLDERFSEEVISKQEAKLREQFPDPLPPPGWEIKQKPGVASGRESASGRLQGAISSMGIWYESPSSRLAMDLGSAKAVLILTWLMVDRRAHDRTPIICEFQSLPWDYEESEQARQTVAVHGFPEDWSELVLAARRMMDHDDGGLAEPSGEVSSTGVPKRSAQRWKGKKSDADHWFPRLLLEFRRRRREGLPTTNAALVAHFPELPKGVLSKAETSDESKWRVYRLAAEDFPDAKLTHDEAIAQGLRVGNKSRKARPGGS